MATKTKPTLEIPEDEDLELEETVTHLDNMVSNLTTAVPKKKEVQKGPTVTVFLPRLEDADSAGLQVDQYEHVTIANMEKETCYKVLRGEYVDVPVEVFLVLKEKYPNL